MFSKLGARLKRTKADRYSRKKNDEQPTPPSPNDQDSVVTKADTQASSARDAEGKADNPRRENLWEVAGERLDEEYRKALGLESARTTDAIEDVIKTTEQKYREYKEGGLKIRIRHGGHINVRDSAKNIILYALQAQNIVKVLLSFHPTGHASSAWSIVSIGLTMIKNDIERRDDIFQTAEYLARILAYYAVVGHNYRKSNVRSDEGLEEALVEVYMAILQYTAEVKRAEKESDAGLRAKKHHGPC